jgi:hypothetical protein
LIRTVTVREPEYDDAELALLVASRRRQAEMGPHGIPMSEAMDPANQFAFKGQEVPRIDYADKALKDAQDRYYKAHKDVNRNGHRWGRVTRRSE